MTSSAGGLAGSGFARSQPAFGRKNPSRSVNPVTGERRRGFSIPGLPQLGILGRSRGGAGFGLGLEQAELVGAVLGLDFETPEDFAILQMGRGFFLVGLDMDDAVIVKGHFGVIDIRALFTRIEKNDPHRRA